MIDEISGVGRSLCVVRRGRIRDMSSQKGKPSSSNTVRSLQQSLVKTEFKSEPTTLSQVLTSLFMDAYIRMCFAARQFMPCVVVGLNSSFQLLDDGYLEVIATAMVKFEIIIF